MNSEYGNDTNKKDIIDVTSTSDRVTNSGDVPPENAGQDRGYEPYSPYPNVGSSGSGSANRYSDYRFTNAHIPEEPAGRKKKGGFGRKALVAVGLGLLFGASAGTGLLLVNLIAGAARTNQAANTQKIEIINEGTEAGISANVVPGEDRILTVTASPSATVNTGGDVATVAENVMPAVVAITNDYTMTTRDFWGQSYSQNAQAAGSGFIVGDNGDELLIATNEHVISDANELGVQFIDGSEAKAQVKGEDEDADIAVIAVTKADLPRETLDAIKIATLGDSDKLKVGQTAIAIGNALGYGQSVTVGVVSALNRDFTLENGTHKLIQTDAAINPGNSGGALLDINGNVIGINEAKRSSSVIEGMGYAIPISSVKPIIDEFMNNKTKAKAAEDKRGYLGISGVDVTAEVSERYNMPRGVYIAQASEGLAADSAGLKRGDIITKFDGQTVQTISQLQDLMSYYEAGQKVDVVVQSPRENDYGYDEKTISVTLQDRAENSSGREEKQGSNGDEEEAAPEEGGRTPGADGNGGTPISPYDFGSIFGNIW